MEVTKLFDIQYMRQNKTTNYKLKVPVHNKERRE